MKGSLLDRLLAKVDFHTSPEGCWVWTARAKTPAGYGLIGRGRASEGMVYAHRAIWELLVGPIPAGYQIDHLCGNKGCVNPEHLEPVTPQENTRRAPKPVHPNALKTHCVHGHPFDEENTYRNPSTGRRACRTCVRAHGRRHDAKRRPRSHS